MKNRTFHFTLRKLTLPCDCAGTCPECGGKRTVRLTVERMAAAIFVNRAHLTDVLNNKPGHGGNTRWKVVKFLKQKQPAHAAALLDALGWDADGNVKPPSST